MMHASIPVYMLCHRLGMAIDALIKPALKIAHEGERYFWIASHRALNYVADGSSVPGILVL